MRIKKRNKHSERYLPLDDIKKIDDEFLSEMENVKRQIRVTPEYVSERRPQLLRCFPIS